MSPLVIKQGVTPRFPYRGMRAAFVSLFVLAGAAFLWTPTRRVVSSFQEAQKFREVGLPGSEGKSLGSNSFFAASDAPATTKRPVVFRLLAPAAKEVGLGGTFNNFQTEKNPMTRRPDGVWEGTAVLPPGRYIYKFKVDGEWELDPTNADNTLEGRGGSILELR